MDQGAPLVAWTRKLVPERNSTLAMMPPGSCAAASTVKLAGAMKIEPLVGVTMLTVGGVVSTTITLWLHCALLPQASVAAQVRVASNVVPQCPAMLVTVLRIVITRLVPPLSVAVGTSKFQAVPSWMVLLVLLQMGRGAGGERALISGVDVALIQKE